MNYILVSEDQLKGKYDAQYSERTTDGRVILPISVLKVITNLKDIDIVSAEEAKALKAEIHVSKDDNTVNEEIKDDENIDKDNADVADSTNENIEDTSSEDTDDNKEDINSESTEENG